MLGMWFKQRNQIQSSRDVLSYLQAHSQKKQLKVEQAIKKIDIDFMMDSVIVEYDPEIITKEEIKEKLESSGYKFVRVAAT